MKSVREDSYSMDHSEPSHRNNYHQATFNQQQHYHNHSFNKHPDSHYQQTSSYDNPGSCNVQSSQHTQSFKDYSIDEIGSSFRRSDTHCMVMSRSDWFSIMKLIYQQIQNPTTQGVNRELLINVIEVNLNKFPLQTLQEYLGQNQQLPPRREKYIAYSHVINTLNSVRPQSDNLIHWDDIIDSLLVTTTSQQSVQPSMSMTQESNVSKIMQDEYEIEKPLRSRRMVMQGIEQVKKLMNKIVLKDNSVLLDLTKIGKEGPENADVYELIQACCENDQINNLRTVSLSQLYTKLNLVSLSKLSSLVILNLSNLNSTFIGDDLKTVNLLNLQCLNLANNRISELSITNHNFPKLKELYVSHNAFTTAKYFLKLDTLKLLDLSYNKISQYEEIICLAFHEGLVVLNLLNNPLHYSHGDNIEFENTIKQILPRVMLLNPQNISKVSCFENFKELVFSVGQLQSKDFEKMQQIIMTTSDNSSDNESSKGIVQRKINIRLALTQNNQQTSLSSQSTPNKQLLRNPQLSHQVSSQNQISYTQVIPPMQQINNENMKTPPYKRTQTENIRQEKTIQVHKDMVKAELANITHTLNYQTSETSNTFESQSHTKLEVPQQIVVKNDFLKYFNDFSKDTNSHQDQSLRSSIRKSPRSTNGNITMLLNNTRREEKPPRHIKIKQDSTTLLNSHQKPSDIYYNQSSTHNNAISSRSQYQQNTLNNSSIMSNNKPPLLQNQEQRIRRDMSAQIQQSVQSNLEVDVSTFKINGYQRNESSNSFQNYKRSSYAEDNTDAQSDMAQYYERQLSSMNINTIRGMPSKEYTKNNNPSIMSQQSISPIKAMMIGKPQDDANNPMKKYSNIMIGSTSNRSKKNSERHSMERLSNLPQNINMTPSTNKSRGQTSKNRVPSRNSALKQQSVSRRHNQTRTSTSTDINTLNDSKSQLFQNKTQNLNLSHIMKHKQATRAQSGKDLTFNNNTHSSQNRSDRNTRNIPIQKYESKTKQAVTSDYSSTQQRGHSYSPSVGAQVTTQQTGRESMTPFRLPQCESPRLYKPNTDYSNRSNYVLQMHQQEYSQTTKHQHSIQDPYDDNYPQFHKTSQDMNTPRFSERVHQKKEAVYQDAIMLINAKRMKKEKKKMLLGQMAGKNGIAQNGGHVHKQSISSSGSLPKQTQSRGYIVPQQHEQQSQPTNLKIDLRPRRN